MDLSKILTIAGKNGLFRVVSQSKTGLIVESLTDEKKLPVFATDRSSALQDISIFTYGEDLPLKDILIRLFEKEDGQPSMDPKSKPEELKAYFETIVADYDKERVYHSDIKKIFSWYNLLVTKGLMSKEDTIKEETGDSDAAEGVASEVAEKPGKGTKNAAKSGSAKKKPDQKPGKIDTGKRKTLQKK
jgi:hypothetical protein